MLPAETTFLAVIEAPSSADLDGGARGEGGGAGFRLGLPVGAFCPVGSPSDGLPDEKMLGELARSVRELGVHLGRMEVRLGASGPPAAAPTGGRVVGSIAPQTNHIDGEYKRWGRCAGAIISPSLVSGRLPPPSGRRGPFSVEQDHAPSHPKRRKRRRNNHRISFGPLRSMGAIDHSHSQQPMPRSFLLFKRCEWLVVNCNVGKRALRSVAGGRSLSCDCFAVASSFLDMKGTGS